MKVQDFPFCCTAKLIYDLGGTATTEGNKAVQNQEQVENYVDKLLTSMFANCIGIYTVITNNQQHTVNAALRKLKFEHSPWESKTQHPETKIRLWWKNPTKYIKEKKAQN